MEASLFSRLSPELRNIVWEFAFTSAYAITLQHSGIQHPLTKTCRQIRAETLSMYWSKARFNAHLDDGPATPLARWLSTIGREQCLLLREVNIWDMHMLNATLHGQDATERMLLGGVEGDGQAHVLEPIGSWLLNRGWYLKDIVMALYSMQLRLLRFCLPGRGDGVGMTSHYAIVPLPSDRMHPVQESESMSNGLPHGDLWWHLGFTAAMMAQLSAELAAGWKEIRLREGRRDIVLRFEGRTLLSVRQEFIPFDEALIF